MAGIDEIRNVVLLGHGGAGKTTLTEQMLNKSGKTNRLGTVEEKNTVSDYDDEEKERGNSIHSAIMHTTHNGKLINIIDTPGYPDFVGAALCAIPAVEACAIVISAAAGIEVNTRNLFNAATKAGKVRFIVINKMEAENVDIPELIDAIQQSFGTQCRCANLPDGNGGIIDCITNDTGKSPLMSVDNAHTELLESAIEADDELMEKYLGGEQIAKEKLADVFVKAMIAGTIIPIIFTEAKDGKGVTEMLDFIVNCLPSPAQATNAILIDGEKETKIEPDTKAPLAGLVFRVGFDPRSNMKFSAIRIFSGTLKDDTHMMHNDDKKPIRPGHTLKAQGAETTETPEAIAGDIVVLAKIEELKVGDLIHEGQFSGKFKMPYIPIPMYGLALEPAARGDEQKIGSALDKLMEEDVCFKVSHDVQTKELVIRGMGDLHLRVMLSKMQQRFKLSVNTKQPKIPYRETITAKADGHYRHKKQSGGAGQFGEVFLKVEPAERGCQPPMQYSWDIFGGSIPGQFETPVAKGINDVMESGIIAGFPMQDIKVSVYDGKYHPVDSKEVAFRAAGKGAFADAVKKAKPGLLEPIVNIEITIPADYMGDITGDLSSRRGRVQGQDMLPGNMITIKAQVPLAEISNYDSQLKSVTGGQGSYCMTLSHYEVVPANVQQQIVAQYAKEKKEQE